MKKLGLFALSTLLASSLAFGGHPKNPLTTGEKSQDGSKGDISITEFVGQEVDTNYFAKGIVRNIDIAKDGTKVFTYDDGSDAEVYLQKGFKTINVSMNSEGFDGNSVISDNGKFVYFTSKRKLEDGKKHQDIYRVSVDDVFKTGNVRLENVSQAPKKADFAATNATGDTLLFSSLIDGDYKLLLNDFANDTTYQLAIPGDNSEADIEGTKAVFISDYKRNGKRYNAVAEIDLSDTAGHVDYRKKSLDHYFTSPKLSADGKVAFIQDYSRVKVMFPDLRKTLSASRSYESKGGVSSVAWDASGKYLTYLAVDETKGNAKINVVDFTNVDPTIPFKLADHQKQSYTLDLSSAIKDNYQEEGVRFLGFVPPSAKRIINGLEGSISNAENPYKPISTAQLNK